MPIEAKAARSGHLRAALACAAGCPQCGLRWTEWSARTGGCFPEYEQ